ncbi:MAG TPA: glutamate 5-kinase, partial [Firmicutes bacterium]|nr:glutamate 5-kinase [Bacillota bacterium]
MLENRTGIKQAKRIVVKVGTSTLTYSSGRLNLKHLEKLVRQIADLHNSGKEVVLVTSGAVGAGVGRLGLKEKPRTIPERQAVAAVGQGLLMQVYTKYFSEYGVTAAQILLTREDMSDRRRYLNARNTLLMLANEYRALPIINENDTVATEELQLRFGDNDTLAA